MPLFSEHISNMYYGGTPSYTSSPYSGYSSSISPLGTSYSALYLNPGGSYSNHSSLSSYSRAPLSSRWIPGLSRNYSPILTTISERGTSSPVRINSPRRIPISKRSYGTGYTPRPININTADIDVSRDRYRRTANEIPAPAPIQAPPRESPSKDQSKSPFMPRVDGKPETGIDSSPGQQRSTIKRGRTVVRLHTVKRKERDSPRKPVESVSPQDQSVTKQNAIEVPENNEVHEIKETKGWRDKLSEDLIYKDKKEKKSLGTKLVEKFIVNTEPEITILKRNLIQDASKILPLTQISDEDLPPTNKSLDRRCSMELLAEQANVLDSLIRGENLSTATLDLSKLGVASEGKNNIDSIKPRDSNPKRNKLTTTKSDNSLHDSLKALDNREAKYFNKRKSLKRSSSGGSVFRLDSIIELPRDIIHDELPAIEENRSLIKLDTVETIPKPKSKTKITSSVEVSPSKSPLKFKIENVTVEVKHRLPIKEITYSSTVEDSHVQDITLKSPSRKTNERRSTKKKCRNVVNDPESPEPEDGNFWDKIGKRETIYLMKRKQNLEDMKEKHRRASYWFPEDEDQESNKTLESYITPDNNEVLSIQKIKDVIISTDNNCQDMNKLRETEMNSNSDEVTQNNTETENSMKVAINDSGKEEIIVSYTPQIKLESDPKIAIPEKMHENIVKAEITPMLNEDHTNNEIEKSDVNTLSGNTNIGDSSNDCFSYIASNENTQLYNLQKSITSENSREIKDAPQELLTKDKNVCDKCAKLIVPEHEKVITKVEESTDKMVGLNLKSVSTDSNLAHEIKKGKKCEPKVLKKSKTEPCFTISSKNNFQNESDEPTNTVKMNVKEQSSIYSSTITENKEDTVTGRIATSKPKLKIKTKSKSTSSKSKDERDVSTKTPSDILTKEVSEANDDKKNLDLATLQNYRDKESKLLKSNISKENFNNEVIHVAPSTNKLKSTNTAAQNVSNKNKELKLASDTLVNKIDATLKTSDQDNIIITTNILSTGVEDRKKLAAEKETLETNDLSFSENSNSNTIPQFPKATDSANIPNITPEVQIAVQTEHKAGEETKAETKEDKSRKSPTKENTPGIFSPRKPVKEEKSIKPLIATPRPLQKRAPQIIHSSESSDSSEEDESSDEESDASEDSADFFECENNADGRTSTGSNDSGFDSSAPTSPATFLQIKKGGDSPGPSSSNATSQIPATDILEQELEQSTAYGIFRKTGRFTPPARSIPRFRKYTIEDFQFIKVLGKGSFGKVLLAELRDTEYYYAVKCLKKDVVLEDDDVECTLIERKVLALGTNHPYLCHLFATFQTDSHLFFVMEYLNGGDLMFHIQQSGRFPEARARFYAAEIVSGLKFLHKRGIVYRDLKLDNILLDFDGHVRIADFGMCKLQIYLDKTADTFCGTPDYMAPEIIKGLKYNQTVDWWSFGVLLYEMLIGQSPFSGCDEDELFWSICNEMPSYPRFLSQESLTILTRLLDKDARTRLGGTECMHGDIREQDFFHHIHWDRLERRDLEAPFRPRVRHPLDTQYFDRAFTGERPRLTAVEPHVLRSMDQEPFRGFSYTNPNATDR